MADIPCVTRKEMHPAGRQSSHSSSSWSISLFSSSRFRHPLGDLDSRVYRPLLEHSLAHDEKPMIAKSYSSQHTLPSPHATHRPLWGRLTLIKFQIPCQRVWLGNCLHPLSFSTVR